MLRALSAPAGGHIMQWLEIISLRTAGIHEKEARMYMKKFCSIAEKYNLSKAFVLTHASVPGDLALIISSQSPENKIMGTDIGKYIADTLKQFGLVDYNCWLSDDMK